MPAPIPNVFDLTGMTCLPASTPICWHTELTGTTAPTGKLMADWLTDRLTD